MTRKHKPTPKSKWTRVHAAIMTKLKLPCMLGFSRAPRIGCHVFDDEQHICVILVNPTVNFKGPEHLILHEVAHHRAYMRAASCFDYDLKKTFCCSGWSGGHCKHWAKVLCGMYKKMGYALPKTTQFEEFAKAAGIQYKRPRMSRSK